MDFNLKSMFNASKIIRLMILVLACIAIWRMWGYLSPATPPIGQDQELIPNSQNAHLSAPLRTEFMEVDVPRKLRVEVYYEALCTDSRHFIMTQLVQSYSQLSSIMTLVFVPYGKASYKTDSNGKLQFTCQHGPKECLANKVHACVTKYVKDEAMQLKLVDCMIQNNFKPMDIGQKCLERLGQDWKSVEKCANSEEGSLILKHLGIMTDSLNPRVTFIPTITIDNSQDDQKLILQDFTRVLCSRYKGKKPPACP